MNNQVKGAAPATRAKHAEVLARLTEESLAKERADHANTKKHLVLALGETDVVDLDGNLLYPKQNVAAEAGKTGNNLQSAESEQSAGMAGTARSRETTGSESSGSGKPGGTVGDSRGPETTGSNGTGSRKPAGAAGAPRPEDYPDTVNPWLRQAQISNDFAGILKLASGYYVALGIDICEIGFLKSDHGWIIVDCGNFVETAHIALRLAELAAGENIRDHIQAVIISHTHPDHYGGIDAFVKDGDAIPIYGPGGYEQSLIDDNLYAGIAMARRLVYQGGMILPRSDTGGAGVGYPGGIRMRGHQSFRFPTVLIEEDQTLDIDGIELDFFLTPNTETRAHMGVYSRTHRVLFLGDNAMGTLHNISTPRGARVRDANYWGSVFYTLYVRYGESVQAVWQGHGIPMIAEETNENLKTYLLDHAAAYKYTNDQALLLTNKGYSRDQIDAQFRIPDEIGKQWYLRPHYGEYSFNARGTYTKYMGFYDGNPVTLHPLERTQRAAKLVEYIGSAELVLEKAKADFEQGEFQWVAEITNELIFLDPENTKARFLCADALEQLGYQAENGVQRNCYLCGALELRHPELLDKKGILYMDNRLIMPYVSPSLLLDYLGINFDGEAALHEEADFVLEITDLSGTRNRRAELAGGCNLSPQNAGTKKQPFDEMSAISGADIGTANFVGHANTRNYSASDAPASFGIETGESLSPGHGKKGELDRELHRIRIYKGTVLHVPVREEEVHPEDLIIRLTKDELYRLAGKNFEPDPERFQKEAYEILKMIETYVVDLTEYQNFALAEPLRKQ